MIPFTCNSRKGEIIRKENRSLVTRSRGLALMGMRIILKDEWNILKYDSSQKQPNYTLKIGNFDCI